ncbi:MAG: hypothetical protein LBU82_04255, partial [Treponema sp.]|nr:hypothetical protein [Treponema sp.]
MEKTDPENGNSQVEIDSANNKSAVEASNLSMARAIAIASSLDNRLLAAQALICGIDGNGSLPPHMKILLTECPAGGIILFRYNLDSSNENIRNLLEETASLIYDESNLLPIIAVDHEGGSVNRFPRGTASLPPAISYWEDCNAYGEATDEALKDALVKIETDSYKAGLEMNKLGVNFNIAPVAEYLTTENCGFLGSRSYGPDPAFVTDAALSFIRGMERAGVTCVIKHFPGSAGPDPHRFPSVLKGGKTDLDNLVFPFAALIKGDARAVMAAHTSVPALDSKIASLSNVIMRDWLREELGFQGLIISDDFSMFAAG